MKLEPTLVTQDPHGSSRICLELKRYKFLVTQHCDILLMDQVKPTTYQEPIKGPNFKKWLKAMWSKMESMYANQVWTMVNPPKKVKPIKCKWIFKKKIDMDGNV